MLKYFDTPISEIKSPETEKASVKLLVKREDMNHPFVSGNKWWKLKYNLDEAKNLGHHTLLTFGGAYSNHIYATAAAAKELNFKSIGIIRGEEVLPLNPTLTFARACGMKLHFVSREEYKNKSQGSFAEMLNKKFGDFYLIPEGGTNPFAIRGCAEFAKEKIWPIECSHVCVPVGTGGTLAGIVSGLMGEAKVIGFSALKDGNFLKGQVKSEVDFFMGTNWDINMDYHFGGYAKRTDELDEFILAMQDEHDLPLDRVYTGKMMYGTIDLIKKGYFERGSTILAIHTGGLQGN